MSKASDDDYLIAMSRAFQTLTRGPDAILSELELGRAHHRALVVIRREEGVLVGELAGILGVTNQSLHKTLRPLLSQRLVRSESSKEGARAKRLYLTTAGQKLEARITGMQHQVFRNVLA